MPTPDDTRPDPSREVCTDLDCPVGGYHLLADHGDGAMLASIHDRLAGHDKKLGYLAGDLKALLHALRISCDALAMACDDLADATNKLDR